MRSAVARSTLGLLAACADSPELGVHTASSVYGTDDRVEVEQAAEPIRSRAMRSTVALVHAEKLEACNPDAIVWTAPTLGEFAGLCSEEPFVNQPVIASCSGTAISPELVLTAKHCVADLAACRGLRFVFGLQLDISGELRQIPTTDVYGCRALFPAPDGVDLTIVQLERPRLENDTAASIAPRAAVGDPLAVPGFPTGIPMKVAQNCEVLDYFAAGDLYYMNCDLMAGNSGSGVLDANGAVLGAYVVGAGDYKPRAPGECKVRFVLAEDGTLPDVPTPQRGGYEPAELAVAALCSTGYASALCNLAPSCGDGQCTGAETSAECAVDCPAPTCGDGICDFGEEHVCADCGEAGLGRCAPDEPPPAEDSDGCATTEPSSASIVATLGALVLVYRRRRRPAAGSTETLH